MKKILFSGLFALAILATAGYGVNRSLIAEKANLSQLGMANLAALAGENKPYNADGAKHIVVEDMGTETITINETSATDCRVLIIGVVNIDCIGSGNLQCSPGQKQDVVDSKPCEGNIEYA